MRLVLKSVIAYVKYPEGINYENIRFLSFQSGDQSSAGMLIMGIF